MQGIQEKAHLQNNDLEGAYAQDLPNFPRNLCCLDIKFHWFSAKCKESVAQMGASCQQCAHGLHACLRWQSMIEQVEWYTLLRATSSNCLCLKLYSSVVMGLPRLAHQNSLHLLNLSLAPIEVLT